VLLERKVDAQYATLLILVWDSANRTLTMSNAGSEPPIICRDGEITKPRVEGVPIGLLEDRDYEEAVYTAEPGDVLLLFSDGIEDQLNSSGDEFGRGRISRAVQKYCALPPRKLVDALFQELDQYMAGTPITDDQTLIGLRVR
jgi:sigma-B regulation protein RsbU (phosphoserine phosphatase)